MRKKGERRLEILQTLAQMLESPKYTKITTAALAAELGCSEAALYRHFTSKARIFEGLIEFIESTLLGLINQITSTEPQGVSQTMQIMQMFLTFASKNKGMTRVIIGDALIHENPQLQQRINALLDKIEAALKQSLRVAHSLSNNDERCDFSAMAQLLRCYLVGNCEQFARSGFSTSTLAHWEAQSLLIERMLNV